MFVGDGHECFAGIFLCIIKEKGLIAQSINEIYNEIIF